MRVMRVMENWIQFIQPYSQAVNELIFKFQEYQEQFAQTGQHVPIELVTGRVKTLASIEEKMKRRNIPLSRLDPDMEYIAGVRIVCQFVEDIYQVVALIRRRQDFKILEERDYISNRKPSGYRSYHIIIEYPVQTLTDIKVVKAEIQVRTMAMNFWATIEHSLNYKYHGQFPHELAQRLQKSAEATFLLDTEMSNIRDEIQKAQKEFEHRKNKGGHPHLFQ